MAATCRLLKGDTEEKCLYCKVEDIDGNLVPVVYKDDKTYRLASTGYNGYILDTWIDAVNLKAFELNMFMFGLGNGMYVRRLLEAVTDNEMAKIIVYEPDIFIIKECFKYYDMSDIINDERFELIISLSGKNLSDYMFRIINYHNVNEVHSSSYINYQWLFEEEYRNYNEQISRTLDAIRATYNLMNNKSLLFYNNTLRNHKRMAESYSLDSLGTVLPKELPVIIVSSGPSLTKNISELKQAKGRSIICAVDSALGSMDAAGIVPDIYITEDPEKKKENFVFDWLEKIPVVASLTSPECVFKEGQKQFLSCLDTYVYGLNEDTKRYFERWDLRSGGSVANRAFRFFQLMGFKRIILVGQDLAYSGNKAHADTVAIDDDDMSETMLYVDDIYGNKVLTSKTLEMYKNWFEEEIEKNAWCEVIDATEGGACIRGTIISTLSEVINKYCVKEVELRQCFDKCDRLFTGEVRKEYIDHIKAIPERMNNIISTGKKVLRNYDRIEKLVRQSKVTGSEMKRLLTYNSKMTADIEDDPSFCYINYINVDSNMEVENNINTVDNDVKQDILNVCNLGRAHVKGIIDAAEKVRADYEIVEFDFNGI